MMVIWKKKALPALLALAFVIAAGCGTTDRAAAVDTLKLALSGMTGSDGVTFEGETALLVDGKQLEDASVYYGGKMDNHRSLSLYTLLPDQEEAGKTAALSDHSTFYSKLEKQNGVWVQLSKQGQGTGGSLAALNPIRQLEELGTARKQVSLEPSAGRGVRELRVELDPVQAHSQLVSELKEEMEELRPAATLKSAGALWQKEYDKLLARLKGVRVNTVYHIKVDARRNLPKSLTRQRTIIYPATGGAAHQEIRVTRVDFYGYR